MPTSNLRRFISEKLGPYGKLVIGTITVWNLFYILLVSHRIPLLFVSPARYLIEFYFNLIAPTLIATAIYAWWYNTPTSSNKSAKFLHWSRISVLSLIGLYSIYFCVNFFCHTEIEIESQSIMDEVTFIRNSSRLPLLPHEDAYTFHLQIDQEASKELSQATPMFKFVGERSILIPWGDYEIQYRPGTDNASEIRKLPWKFDSLKEILPLP